MTDLPDDLRRAIEEFERELEAHEPLGPPVPDPVVAEIFTNACRRELALARDNLASARERYETAIREARTAGYSWGEIGRLLGVSKQQIHRQFSRKIA